MNRLNLEYDPTRGTLYYTTPERNEFYYAITGTPLHYRPPANGESISLNLINEEIITQPYALIDENNHLVVVASFEPGQFAMVGNYQEFLGRASRLTHVTPIIVPYSIIRLAENLLLPEGRITFNEESRDRLLYLKNHHLSFVRYGSIMEVSERTSQREDHHLMEYVIVTFDSNSEFRVPRPFIGIYLQLLQSSY